VDSFCTEKSKKGSGEGEDEKAKGRWMPLLLDFVVDLVESHRVRVWFYIPQEHGRSPHASFLIRRDTKHMATSEFIELEVPMTR
jgi:hypothetical protein